MKLLMYAVPGLVVLVVLAAGFLLLPPHLQIRNLTIEIPTLDQIRALQVPELEAPQVITFVATAEQGNGAGGVGHVGVLVTWLSGKQLLIDAGMGTEAAVAFGEPMESLQGWDPTQAYGPIEELLGDDINQIDGVIFTHLHSDHTQGVTAICAAMESPATIFQTRLQAEQQNHLTVAGQQLIDTSSCKKSVLGDEPIKSIEGFPGVYAVSAGGHTPGSTVIVVLTEDHTSIFSGDLTNAIANVRNNEGKGWLYSNLVVPENTVLLEEWRLWLQSADEAEGLSVYPAHDIGHMRQSEIISELR
jgi:glyoxylase-like metal-dependent hydrolase (beta-lactamase superfamily II)